MVGDNVTKVEGIPFMTPTTCMQIICVHKKPNKKANMKRKRLFIGWFAIANAIINLINVIYTQFQYLIFVETFSFNKFGVLKKSQDYCLKCGSPVWWVETCKNNYFNAINNFFNFKGEQILQSMKFPLHLIYIWALALDNNNY